MELRREHVELAEERDGIKGMLASEKDQWKLVGAGLRAVQKQLGVDRPDYGVLFEDMLLADGAELLVVGSRGSGGFAGLV